MTRSVLHIGNASQARAPKVKLTDVNLLLYAYDTSSAQHARARAWPEERLSAVEAFGFAWATLLAFVGW